MIKTKTDEVKTYDVETIEEYLHPLYFNDGPLEAYAHKFIGDVTHVINGAKSAIALHDWYCRKPYSSKAFADRLRIISDYIADAIPSELNEELLVLTYAAMNGQAYEILHHPIDELMTTNMVNALYEAAFDAAVRLILDMSTDMLYSCADKLQKA